MFVGAYRLYSTVTWGGTSRSVEWDEKLNGYNELNSVRLDGIIGNRRINRQLLVRGGKSVSGVAFGVTLRIGSPVAFDKPEEEQTEPRPGGTMVIVATKLIGWVFHHDPSKDDETGEKFPQQAFAELSVDPTVYNDVWHWIRSGCLGEASMWVDVFGKGMRIGEGYYPDYQWIHDERDYRPLYAGGFGFSVKNDIKTERKPGSV